MDSGDAGGGETPGPGGTGPTKKVDPPGFGAPGAAPPGTPASGGNTWIAGAPQPTGSPQPAGPGGQPSAGSPPGGPAMGSAPGEPLNFMNDPVVGWLVITNGPGKGQGLRLGKGLNTIGRGETNRIALNYGDNSISRDKHCIVTFEPKQRVYYIQNAGGTNLTYVGDVVVLEARQLHNGETIQIGDTEMRFVAFCGEDFSWDDTPA
ncbi:MAG: FHA domain-containing protein [Pseudomonadota bacterium]